MKKKTVKTIFFILISTFLFNISSININAYDENYYSNDFYLDYQDEYYDEYYSDIESYVYYDLISNEEVYYNFYVTDKSVIFKWEPSSNIKKVIFYKSQEDEPYEKLIEVDARNGLYVDDSYDQFSYYDYRMEVEYVDGRRDVVTEMTTIEEIGEIDEVGEYIIIFLIIIYLIGIILILVPKENLNRENIKEKNPVSIIVWTIFFFPVGLYKIIKHREENNRGFYIKWMSYLIMPLGLYLLWKEDTFERKNKIIITVGSAMILAFQYFFSIVVLFMLIGCL